MEKIQCVDSHTGGEPTRLVLAGFPDVAGLPLADAVHRLALETRPTHLVVLDSWDAIYRIADGLRAHGWRVDPVRPAGRYQVFSLAPPP